MTISEFIPSPALPSKPSPFKTFHVLALAASFVPSMLLAQANGFASSGSSRNAVTAKPVSATATVTNPGMPPVRDFSTSVRDGILTVDGMVGKAGMNYDIHQGFMYFTIPGVGTAIVAQSRFMNAAPQQNAFRGNELIINVNGHVVELTNSGPLVGGVRSAEAWVAFDPLFGANITFPQMGYGNSTARPYVWPGSKAIGKKNAVNAVVTPPPMPKSIQPKPEISSSYSVTVPATGAANAKQ